MLWSNSGGRWSAVFSSHCHDHAKVCLTMFDLCQWEKPSICCPVCLLSPFMRQWFDWNRNRALPWLTGDWGWWRRWYVAIVSKEWRRFLVLRRCPLHDESMWCLLAQGLLFCFGERWDNELMAINGNCCKAMVTWRVVFVGNALFHLIDSLLFYSWIAKVKFASRMRHLWWWIMVLYNASPQGCYVTRFGVL